MTFTNEQLLQMNDTLFYVVIGLLIVIALVYWKFLRMREERDDIALRHKYQKERKEFWKDYADELRDRLSLVEGNEPDDLRSAGVPDELTADEQAIAKQYEELRAKGHGLGYSMEDAIQSAPPLIWIEASPPKTTDDAEGGLFDNTLFPPMPHSDKPFQACVEIPLPPTPKRKASLYYRFKSWWYTQCTWANCGPVPPAHGPLSAATVEELEQLHDLHLTRKQT